VQGASAAILEGRASAAQSVAAGSAEDEFVEVQEGESE
jgi:hypothetical protein